MITEAFVNLCATYIPVEYPTRNKIRIRASLLTDGVRLLVMLEEVTQRLRELLDSTTSILEDGDVTHLERLDSVWSNIRSCETTVDEIKKSWSLNSLEITRWWLDHKRVQTKAAQDIRQLRLVREKCQGISGLVISPNSELENGLKIIIGLGIRMH